MDDDQIMTTLDEIEASLYVIKKLIKPGIVGPTGPKGETGAPGPKGPTGLRGKDGEQGLRGPTGRQGESPRGRPGLKGKTGLDGPQGAKGRDGKPGSPGVMGPTGDTGPTGSPGADQRLRNLDVRTGFVNSFAKGSHSRKLISASVSGVNIGMTGVSASFTGFCFFLRLVDQTVCSSKSGNYSCFKNFAAAKEHGALAATSCVLTPIVTGLVVGFFGLIGTFVNGVRNRNVLMRMKKLGITDLNV